MRKDDRNIVLEFRSSQKVINDRSRTRTRNNINNNINDNIGAKLRLSAAPFIQNSSFSCCWVGVNEGQAKTFLRQITGQQLWLTEINSRDARLLQPGNN